MFYLRPLHCSFFTPTQFACSQEFRTHLEFVNGHRATLDADPAAALSPTNEQNGGGLASAAVEARLKEHWLKLAGTIVAAAHAVGEADQRGAAGTLGAFRTYRTPRHHTKDLHQKRMDLQHNEVVALFRLRRLSDPTDAAPAATGRNPAAFATRGFTLRPRPDGSVPGSPADSSGGFVGAFGGRAAWRARCRRAARGVAGPWDPEATWRRPWNAAIVAIVCLQVRARALGARDVWRAGVVDEVLRLSSCVFLG